MWVKKGRALLRFELWSHVQKSAAELKLKQKYLKCKSTIQISTFNVRTFNRIGQLLELTASAIDHNIDIISVPKHRYLHSEDIKYHDTGNRWTFVSASAWNNSVNATMGYIGMLIGPRALKSLNNTEKIHGKAKVYDQIETTYNSSVLIQDIAWRTCLERWTIETGSERGSVKSVLAARQDDDDDNDDDEYHINLCGFPRAKVVRVREKLSYNLTHSSGDRVVHAFPYSISQKVNVIAQL